MTESNEEPLSAVSKEPSEGDSCSCQHHPAGWLPVADEWLSQKPEMPRTGAPSNRAAQDGHGEGRGAEPSPRAPGPSRQQTAGCSCELPRPRLFKAGCPLRSVRVFEVVQVETSCPVPFPALVSVLCLLGLLSCQKS